MSFFSTRPLGSSFQTPPSLQGRRRWEWLVGSIALNLILIGLILSFMLGGKGLLGDHAHQPFVTWQMELLPTLQPPDAAIVTAATRRISDQQAEGDARVHTSYMQTRAILAVEPLDRDALRRSLDEMTAIRNGEQTTIGAIFLEELEALSPDGRAKVLAGMERESRRRFGPSGH